MNLSSPPLSFFAFSLALLAPQPPWPPDPFTATLKTGCTATARCDLPHWSSLIGPPSLVLSPRPPPPPCPHTQSPPPPPAAIHEAHQTSICSLVLLPKKDLLPLPSACQTIITFQQKKREWGVGSFFWGGGVGVQVDKAMGNTLQTQ